MKVLHLQFEFKIDSRHESLKIITNKKKKN